MKKIALAIILAVLAMPAMAEEVTVIWENPTESVDGTPVEPLDRFVLYRRVGDSWDEVGSISYEGQGVTSGKFDLPCGDSLVAARVFTVAGVNSYLSNRVDYTVECNTDPKKPKKPQIIRIL